MNCPMPSFRATMIALLLAGAYLVAGTMDYNDQVAAASERKAAQREPAPIYSRRCERKGMDVLATKADKGPWKLACIPKRTLSV